MDIDASRLPTVCYFKTLLLISLLCSDTSDDDNNIHSGMIDLGIAEPSKIYCNIGGGLGILGCYTCDYKSIDVIKELGAFSK